MADKTGQPQPNRTEGAVTIDADEFNKMLRGENTEVEETVKEAEKPAEKPEPKVEKEEETAETEEVDVKEQLRRANETISRMSRDIDEVRRGVGRKETREDLEMIEVLPNVRLPKDESKWPVRLTEDAVEAVGLDKSATKGLNVLANALVQFVSDVIPDIAVERVMTQMRGREDSSRSRQTFEEEYPDLKGNEDIMEVVERKFRQDNADARMSNQEYQRGLARAARSRLASMRGMSYDEYVREVSGGTTRTTDTPARSRAVSTVSGRARQVTKQGGKSELDDMIDNR